MSPPSKTLRKNATRKGEGDRACAMRLRVYPTRGQESRLGQWVYCAQKFRNEAVAFCASRRRARGTWIWQHPSLAKAWKPEEFQGSDATACSKWLTTRLDAARGAIRLEAGLVCSKQDMVSRVSEAFGQMTRLERQDIHDGWLLTVPRTVFDQVLQDLSRTESKAISDRVKAKAGKLTSRPGYSSPDSSGKKKKKKKLAGFPSFRKWRYPSSIRLQVDARKNKAFRKHWEAGGLFVPGLGLLKFRDDNYILPNTPPALITVSRDAAGHFHASFLCVEKEYQQIKPTHQNLLGKALPLDPETGLPVARALDLSLTHLGVDDQGQSLGRKRHLKRFQNTLRRKNKSLARKQKGSARWHKAKRELGALHVRVANCREAELRLQAKALVDPSAIVCLEDYFLAFMLQNQTLAASTQDAGLYRFKQLIAQECQKQGKLLLQCGRFDASTQTCSACEFQNTQLKNNLKLRTWNCPQCKAHHDRDHNAAINILIMALVRAIADQELSLGPENGPGVSNSRPVHPLHPDLSTFIARGGLTAILDHTRSKVRRGVQLRPGLEEAGEARVLPMQPMNARRERVMMG